MLITILFEAVRNKSKDDLYRRIESNAAMRPHKLYNTTDWFKSRSKVTFCYLVEIMTERDEIEKKIYPK
jgi:hypothetical protein